MNRETARPILHPYWKGAAAFGIIVGFAMLAVSAWLLSTGAYLQLGATELASTVHLVTQTATAIILIVAGFALVSHKSWARKAYFVAIGALLFAVINAISFYGERGNIPLVIFFIAVAVVGVFFAMRVEE